jgi:hypothetical protein
MMFCGRGVIIVSEYCILPVVLALHMLVVLNVYTGSVHKWLENAATCGPLVEIAQDVLPGSAHVAAAAVLVLVSIITPSLDYFVVWHWRNSERRRTVIGVVGLVQAVFCFVPVYYYTRMGIMAGLLQHMQACSPTHPLPSTVHSTTMPCLIPVMLMWALVPTRLLSSVLMQYVKRKPPRVTFTIPPSRLLPGDLDSPDQNVVFLRREPSMLEVSDDAVLD